MIPFVTTSALWGRGFRPFFVLAAVYGGGLVALWAGMLGGWISLPVGGQTPVLWHAHEMIYGFIMAVVAGFLLTAVANWTSWAPVRHGHLVLLCLLWLAGRIIHWIPDVPHPVGLTAELLFLPALTVSLYIPLRKTRSVRNYVFIGLLSGLFVFDLLFMLAPDIRWLHAAMLLILAIASLISGRIIPAFTTSGLRRYGDEVPVYNQQKLDITCLLSLILLAGLQLTPQSGAPLSALVATCAGLAHLWRGRRFHSHLSIKEPLLWILHAGYYWLALGLLLLGASYAGWLSSPLAWHTLTIGAVGSLVIGMMSRVALGHTGRPLTCHPLTVVAFYLMQIAVLLRVFGPLLLPQQYLLWISLSGTAWTGCFALYLWIHLPILLQPRPDGAPA